MKVTKHKKQLNLSLYDIIRFQLTIYFFTNNIKLGGSQLDVLAYLGMWGQMNISDFCEQIVDQEIFSNPQSVRNFILKCIKEGHIIRNGLGNKEIKLSYDNTLSNGNILIEMQVYHVESKKS